MSFVESSMDDYSYVVNDSDVIYTTIGKFCSIAAMKSISGIGAWLPMLNTR